MLGWFKLNGLRMRTIAVVEQEYGRKLAVAGGADTPLFNMTTRRFRDLGCNEYDAGAAFIAANALLDYKHGREGKVGLLALVATTMRLMPQMVRPDIAERNLDLAREAAVK